MKTITLTILLWGMVMFLSACSDDEKSQPQTSVPPMCMIDANRIETTFGYAIDSCDLWLLKNEPYYFDKESRAQHKAYYDNIGQEIKHQPLGYRNLRLLLCTRTSTEPERAAQNESEQEALDRYYDFLHDVSRKILLPEDAAERLKKEWEKEGIFDVLADPIFFTARFTGDVTITADQKLFGEKAGTDLSRYFCVEAPSLCLPQGTLTDFKFLSFYEKPMSPTPICEYFANGTWLQKNYAFQFRDIPEEIYETVNITITLPIECDMWRDFYLSGQTDLSRKSRTVRARFAIRLGEYSDFEQKYQEYRNGNDQIGWK